MTKIVICKCDIMVLYCIKKGLWLMGRAGYTKILFVMITNKKGEI